MLEAESPGWAVKSLSPSCFHMAARCRGAEPHVLHSASDQCLLGELSLPSLGCPWLQALEVNVRCRKGQLETCLVLCTKRQKTIPCCCQCQIQKDSEQAISKYKSKRVESDCLGLKICFHRHLQTKQLWMCCSSSLCFSPQL